MVMVHVYVDKGDLTGNGHGRPFREYVISYRKIRKSSDLGLGKVRYSFTGHPGSAIIQAKTLAKLFHNDGYSVRVIVSDCGKQNGTFALSDGKFWRQ